MKQLLFILFVVTFSLNVVAQNKKINYLVTEAGDTLRVGSMIKLGLGTQPDGKYKYIIGLFDLSPSFAGYKLEIKQIKRLGNEKMGYTHELKLHPGVGVVSYFASVENALKVGELEVIK